MRPFILYPAVAASAFVIGSLVVYIFFYQSGSAVGDLPKSNQENFPNVFISKPADKQSFTQRTEFLTDKEKALVVFEPTINKWLKDRSLESVVEPSPATIRKINEGGFLFADESQLLQMAGKIYRPELIDVNGDGTGELAVLSDCSDAGECRFWIFKKTKKDFEIILGSYQEVGKFKLQKNKTKGYFNIETTGVYQESALSMPMKIYKFDGREYSISDCFDYQFRYKDKNEKLHNLKNPRLLPLHCC
jgi:hypothetical protein